MILATNSSGKIISGVAMVWFLVMASCQNENVSYLTLDGKAQGTTFHITYKDSLQRNFSSEVDSLFHLVDRSMSLWDSTSLITRINRNETELVSDEHFINVFNKAQEIAEETGGAFDVTIGPLVKAWGFSVKSPSASPDSAMVDSLIRISGFRKVKLVNGKIEKSDPRIQLDFNGIAQGYTVDLIASFLRSNGIHHFLVEVGGEVRTSGINDRRTIWQVGIDKPVDSISEGRPLQTSISLKEKALATSGSYRKFIVREGLKLSHVIDPATGYPTQQNLLSVSVIAYDCTTADAYATAFLVMGMEKALAMAAQKKLEIYCIYADQAGRLQVSSTSGFSQ